MAVTKPGCNITSRDGASLATFLVSSPDDIKSAWGEHVSGDLRANLGGVILMGIGFKPDQCTQFLQSLPNLDCPVCYVDTYGVIGWHTGMQRNTESEEKGRGSEYGAGGNPQARPGITVIAVRKSMAGKPGPVVSTNGVAPTVNQGALAHVIMCRFRNQLDAEKFMYSKDQAMGTGGFCREAFEFKNGTWQEAWGVFLTFMKSDRVAVNACVSYGVYDADGAKPSSKKECLMVAKTLPEGYRPQFIGHYQCFMRGYNAYQEADTEAKGLAELFGEDVPCFGMSCFGEIGNSLKWNPDGWNAGHTSDEVTWHHSFCTCLLVYAEKTPEVWARPVITNIPNLDYDNEAAKEERFGVHQAQLFRDVDSDKNKDPNAYKKHLRRVLFKTVGVPDNDGINFWKVPGGSPAEKCYAQSAPAEEVDAFLSHALKSDPNCPTMMMRKPIKYSVHKCVDIFVASHNITSRRIAEGKVSKDKAGEAMQNLTFWCDTACVDHSDTSLKMYILKSHLEDFVQNSKYFVCLMSTQYFSRLWCLYEFACACMKREDIDTIVVANACLAFFESERIAIAESIVKLSVANSSCFDPLDKALITDKIQTEFASTSAFERFVKFSSCALAARSAIFWAVEHYDRWLWLWSDTARQCGFVKLAAVLTEVDVPALRKEAFKAFPDAPAETKIKDRMQHIETTFTKDWFDAKVRPMLNEELVIAMPTSKIIAMPTSKSRVSISSVSTKASEASSISAAVVGA